MSPSDMIVVLFVAVLLIGVVLLSRRGQNKSSGCGGGCAGCPHSSSCPSQQKNTEK